MGDVIQFKSDSPHSWTVEDALELALEMVRKKQFEADTVYVALCRGPKNGEDSGRLNYTLAGMDLVEAIGWLDIHKHKLLSETS